MLWQRISSNSVPSDKNRFPCEIERNGRATKALESSMSTVACIKFVLDRHWHSNATLIGNVMVEYFSVLMVVVSQSPRAPPTTTLMKDLNILVSSSYLQVIKIQTKHHILKVTTVEFSKEGQKRLPYQSSRVLLADCHEAHSTLLRDFLIQRIRLLHERVSFDG